MNRHFTARDRLRWLAAAAVSTAIPVSEAAEYPRNLTKDDIDRWMTELSNWGRWGKEDQAGTVNLITPAKRKQAAALIQEGISISMSLDATSHPRARRPSKSPPTDAPATRGNTRCAPPG